MFLLRLKLAPFMFDEPLKQLFASRTTLQVAQLFEIKNDLIQA
jgi:hypothetical protein